ncbi:MAG: low molecular weight phosphotyrosine protein phosphatase [Deltaproteobacteria bacterium]|nr:low molecular weight phosphotyrosine protein phosphatase [Deltaproteobacteria bacterium]
MVRLLIVCLGNICRSPIAHGVLRERIAARGLDSRVSVDSCGTSSYHNGEQADPNTRRVAARRGVDIEWHRSRQLLDSDFYEFEVLIAMDGSNEADIRDRLPPNSDVVIRRYMEFVPGAPGPDMPDPYYGGASGFERVQDFVEAGADPLIDWALTLAADGSS